MQNASHCILMLLSPCKNRTRKKLRNKTSYPRGRPGPGLGGFQVTLICDAEMLWAFTSVGASLGSVEFNMVTVSNMVTYYKTALSAGLIFSSN